MSKMKRDGRFWARLAGRLERRAGLAGVNGAAVEAIEAGASAGRMDSSTSAGRAANMPGWASPLFCGEEPVRPVHHTHLALAEDAFGAERAVCTCSRACRALFPAHVSSSAARGNGSRNEIDACRAEPPGALTSSSPENPGVFGRALVGPAAADGVGHACDGRIPASEARQPVSGPELAAMAIQRARRRRLPPRAVHGSRHNPVKDARDSSAVRDGHRHRLRLQAPGRRLQAPREQTRGQPGSVFGDRRISWGQKSRRGSILVGRQGRPACSSASRLGSSLCGPGAQSHLGRGRA